MKSSIVRCLGLTKSFGNHRAVDGLDLNVEQGKILALLGPSGSGKTTTLRLIAGFDPAEAGTIEIGSRIVDGPGVHLPPEKRRVGMVFQDYALFPHLSVAENVAYGLPKSSRRKEQVQKALEVVGLEGLGGRMPHELSGGQQQRVALARALTPDPDVLLLDEPFSNLHPELRVQVREEVRDILKSRETTAIFVTHDQQEALFMGDLVAIINQGRLEQVDTPERIFHAPQTRFVASFMGTADFIPARLEGGLLHTEVGIISPMEGVVDAGVTQGLELMARPDDLTMHPSENGNGHIAARIFQGAFNLYRVTLDSGKTIHCLLPHPREYPVGTRVQVKLDPGHPLLCFLNHRVVAGTLSK